MSSFETQQLVTRLIHLGVVFAFLREIDKGSISTALATLMTDCTAVRILMGTLLTFFIYHDIPVGQDLVASLINPLFLALIAPAKTGTIPLAILCQDYII